MEAAVIKQEVDRLRVGLRSLPISPAVPLLVSLAAAGAVLRLYQLGARSIWLDEAYSIAISQRGLLETIRMVALTDAHPPLYYLALNLWLAFGSTEEHVRVLSALFSGASILLMYLLARSVYGDRRAGLVGAAILAFSPFHVWYAQEARMYAMLVFFVLASACFFVQALRGNSPWTWAGFSVTAALAAYTDYGAFWYLAALALFYLFARRRFPGTGLGWSFSHAGIALLYLPWLPSFLTQARQVTESFWLPPPSFQAALGAFLDFHSFNFPWMELSVLYMAAMFVLAYIVPEKEGWQRSVPSFLLFAPVVISALVSLRQPIFLSRNLIPASLGYYLLVTGVVWRFRSARAAALILLPMIAANLISFGHNTWFEETEDWRSVAGYVEQSVGERGEVLVVFVPSYAELPFSYYFDAAGLPLETQGYPGDELLLHPQPKAMDEIGASLEGHAYIWLVLRDVEVVDPDWQVKGWLDSHGYERMRDRSFGDLRVITYLYWNRLYPVPPRTINVQQLVRHCIGEDGVMEDGCRAALLGYAPFNPNVRYHRVNAGETLSWIALRYGSTVAAILEANGIENANRIFVGQELIVPLVEALQE